jgi:hypothetical protein
LQSASDIDEEAFGVDYEMKMTVMYEKSPASSDASSNDSKVDQSFTFILQVVDEQNYAIFLESHDGQITNETVSRKVSFLWHPEKVGLYSMKLFIWTGLSNSSILAAPLKYLVWIPNDSDLWYNEYSEPYEIVVAQDRSTGKDIFGIKSVCEAYSYIDAGTGVKESIRIATEGPPCFWLLDLYDSNPKVGQILPEEQYEILEQVSLQRRLLQW